jgi:Phage terminase, small subunit
VRKASLVAFPTRRVRIKSATRPDWLRGAAAEEWDRLAPTMTRLGHLNELFAMSFAALCCLAVEVRRAHKSADPAVIDEALRSGLFAELLKAHEAFYMTPASRVRADIGPDGQTS